MNASARPSKHARTGHLWALMCAPLFAVSTADAASANSLYVYDLTNARRDVPVPNLAATNHSVSLTLFKDYTPTSTGVRFQGDLQSKQSVGYAKPATGNTLRIPANNAVGVAAQFTFTSCSNDTDNVAQIGRAGYQGQLKLQLSKCRSDGRSVVVQCRVVGERSSSNQGAVSASRALSPGVAYVAQCIKEKDPQSGQAKVRIITRQLSGTNVEVEREVPPTGVIQSDAYLSIANKYALPTQAANTDQFVGTIARVAFCQGTDANAVQDCLDDNL